MDSIFYLDPRHTIGFKIADGLINPWTSPRISDAGIPQESVRTVYHATPKKKQYIIGKKDSYKVSSHGVIVN
jgi:hypothetical protein